MQLLRSRCIRTFWVSACCPLFVFGFTAQTVGKQVDGHSNSVIAASGVGPLKIGDSRQRTLELFPFKHNVDQEYDQPEPCGTEMNWVDLRDPKHVGNVFIHFREGAVFQIDTADPSFRTPDGIGFLSSPEQVRRRHRNLEAWVLSGNTGGEALGERPLVYWIDRNAGIAFSFAYSQSERKRYLYEIIVFKPGAEICPHDDSTNSPDKKKLTPFALNHRSRVIADA
jgi:hypothetical protein